MYSIYADNELLYQPDVEGYELITAKVNTEVGKAGTFEFSFAPSHPMYSRLNPLKTRIIVDFNGQQIFMGRVLYSKRDMYGIKEVYCEGELAYLVDSIQRPYKFEGYPVDLLRQFVAKHNEQVESEKQFVIGDTSGFPEIDPDNIHSAVTSTTSKYITTRTTAMHGGASTATPVVATIPANKEVTIISSSNGWYFANYNGKMAYIQSENVKKVYTTTVISPAVNPYLIKAESSSYEKTLDEINSKIVDAYGGYLVTRCEDGVLYLDYVAEFTAQAQQTIKFGKNLLDLSDHITAEDVYTVMIPLGKSNNGNRLTIEAANGGVDYIESSEGIAMFGRVVRTVEFDDQKDAVSLKAKAEETLVNGIKQALTVNVDAVDLCLLGVDTDMIRAGVKIRVISEPHGFDDIMLCTAVSCDLLNPESTEYTIGDTYSTLTDRQNRQVNRLKNNVVAVSDIGARVTMIEETNES